MSRFERVRRSVPDRRWPDRRAVGAIGLHPEKPNDRAGKTGSSTGAAPDPVIDAAVAGAYRVIEEYLRCGQQAARAWSPMSSERGDTMRRDDFGMPGGQGNPWPMFKMWQDSMQAWFGMMAPFMGAAGCWPPGARPSPSPYHPAERTQVAGMMLEVDAPGRDVTVAVDLRSCPSDQGLRLRPLEPEQGDTGRPISDVFLQVRDGRLHGHVRVARDQPPGRYRGEIYEQYRDEPIGSLSVVVRET